MNDEELHQDDIETLVELPVIEKLSLADRLAKSKAARARRRQTKQVLQTHSYKEEKDARERLAAKRLLEKQKKQSQKKLVDICSESVYIDNIPKQKELHHGNYS